VIIGPAVRKGDASQATTDYNNVDDISDGLITRSTARYVPRVTDASSTACWGDPSLALAQHDEDKKGFTDLLPAAARSLAREVNNIQSAPLRPRRRGRTATRR
jgi:hypothetical protein